MPLVKRVKALYLSHKNRGNNSKAIVPFEFIDCYHTFEDCFSVNWERSVQDKRLHEWDTRNTDMQEGLRDDCQKIRAMQCFIEASFDNFTELLPVRITKYINKMGLDNQHGILENIRPDEAIVENMIKLFRKSYDDVMNGHGNHDSIEVILCFVNNVGRNPFLGRKSVSDMKERRQNNRLKVYVAIMLAIEDLLFDAVTDKGLFD